MSKESWFTLVLMAVLLTAGSVAVIALDSAIVTVLFSAAIIVWSLRLFVQVHRDKR